MVQSQPKTPGTYSKQGNGVHVSATPKPRRHALQEWSVPKQKCPKIGCNFPGVSSEIGLDSGRKVHERVGSARSVAASDVEGFWRQPPSSRRTAGRPHYRHPWQETRGLLVLLWPLTMKAGMPQAGCSLMIDHHPRFPAALSHSRGFMTLQTGPAEAAASGAPDDTRAAATSGAWWQDLCLECKRVMRSQANLAAPGRGGNQFL
jgi:hypothetical protein